jgi:hypothetical protein
VNEREIKEDRSTFFVTLFGAKSNKKYLNCFVRAVLVECVSVCVS